MSIDLKIEAIVYFLIIIEYCIAVMIIRFKSKKSVKISALLITCIISMLWMFSIIIEKLFIGTDYHIYIIRMPIILAQLSSTSVLVFVLFHLDILNSKNKGLSIILYIPRIILIIPCFTNKYFYLIIEEYVNHAVVTKWGLFLNIGKGFSYAYISLALIILIWDTVKNRKYYISNIMVMSAVALPLTYHLLTFFKVIRPNVVDLFPLIFSIVIVLYTLSIFKYRNEDIINKASYELFNHTESFIMVLNKKGTVVDYNRSFGSLHSSFIRKGETEVLKAMEKIFAGCIDQEAVENLKFDVANKIKEMKRHIMILEHEKDIRNQYIFELIPVFKHENEKEYCGKLVIINDITDQRESNILEERRRLSDYLHDSIGNSINVISLNLEYIIDKLGKDDHKDCPSSKDILESAEMAYKKSTIAFIDLRRIIDGLCPVDIEKNGVIWALESLFYKIRVKGIKIDFEHSEIDNSLINKNQISTYLYTICQEGINNSIVHGNASEIFVSLLQCKKQFDFSIVDNGIGCVEVIANKGIEGIKKKVKDLHGTVDYGTMGDVGFFIKISIPIV